eukprot:TRINITY_DN2077_c0_g1_i2.p1 TRINITY_DN2077_c0_g1~~TRINITY_DN2077_c0_g1_i2.p1  ORF type:complete len:788 (+),score=157.31 TRINITY_DN2077_c0_g1_i2:262-2625(+)
MAPNEREGEGAQADPRGLNRVKVYQLNQDGAWEDQGTGYASLANKFVVVYAEEQEQRPSTSSVILEAPVLPTPQVAAEEAYQRQGDTIISWSDPNLQVDLALSFQESERCTVFWTELQVLQGRTPEDSGGQYGQGGEQYAQGAQQQLPEPSMENLSEIATIVENCGMYQRDYMAQSFARKEYLRQLLEHFGMCEDLENAEGLAALFRIFKGMVMLNDNCLLETLLSEDYIMRVIGVLEYDPELRTRTPHREYLTKTAVYKEVIPIHDDKVRINTHQNFRVMYLKDVILAKYLDDHTFSTLSTLVYFNSVDIVDRLQGDSGFMDNLFSALLDQNNTVNRLSDLMGFLQELCQLAKNLQAIARGQFYRKLVDRGLSRVIEMAICHTNRSLRLCGVDIASGFIGHESHLCRTHLMQQSPKCKLLGLLVEQLFADNDAGIKSQIAELLKNLLDPELMEGTSEKDDFLNMFYESLMEPLVSCITSENVVSDKIREFRKRDSTGQCRKEQMDSDLSLVAVTQNQVCEILAFCVQQHGYRIKYFILRHNIVQKALQMVLKKSTSGAKPRRVAGNYLTLSVMRFVRACVGLKDEFYNRHLVKNNLFEPVMVAFQQNGSRYNLFNSAVIEMVEFCRKENVKSLVGHLVEAHADKFKGIEYVSVFKDLVTKHEQNVDAEQGREAADTQQQQQQQQPWRRKAESDDESYFNESDDDDAEQPPALSASDMEIGPARPPPNGLEIRSGGPAGGSQGGNLVGSSDVRPTSPTVFHNKSRSISPTVNDAEGPLAKKLKVDAS